MVAKLIAWFDGQKFVPLPFIFSQHNNSSTDIPIFFSEIFFPVISFGKGKSVRGWGQAADFKLNEPHFIPFAALKLHVEIVGLIAYLAHSEVEEFPHKLLPLYDEFSVDAGISAQDQVVTPRIVYLYHPLLLIFPKVLLDKVIDTTVYICLA